MEQKEKVEDGQRGGVMPTCDQSKGVPRLDVDVCKSLLGRSCNLTDDDVICLRDELYSLAALVVETYCDQEGRKWLKKESAPKYEGRGRV